MTGIRLVVLQFKEPMKGYQAMEPLLALVADVPDWKARLAAAHGTIPSLMCFRELLELPHDDTPHLIQGATVTLEYLVDVYFHISRTP